MGVVGPEGYVPTKQDWMKQVSGRGGEVMLAILDIRKGRIQGVCNSTSTSHHHCWLDTENRLARLWPNAWQMAVQVGFSLVLVLGFRLRLRFLYICGVLFHVQ